MYLGAHVSIAKSIALAPERGRSIGCEAIQIFTKNQMQWKTRDLSVEETEGFKEQMKSSGMSSAIAHDSYLINLGSSSEDLWKKSVESLKHEAERCDALGIKKLVIHPGANKNEEEGIERIAEGIKRTLDESRVTIVLETTAGQGSYIGRRFEQLSSIMERTGRERVSVCFDTCHAYASGYDIRNDYEGVMDEFDRMVGIGNLSAMHLNDSKGSLGSHLDRHEDIGNGTLGIEPFRRFVNDKRFSDLPGII
jgi:deoxyribonuclease-4